MSSDGIGPVKRFPADDSDVIVVIGSGAGGGTLANELCQKGASVVLLEAGKHHRPGDFINDEWPSLNQLAWLDERTTSGSWRIAEEFPNLPAWTCKTVGGTTVHWAGCCPRFKEWEFRNRSEHGPIDGANLLDWPIGLSDLEPYYVKAEDRLGVTRTNGIPPLPANNNFKVMANGAKRAGYKDVSTGLMAINTVPRDGRPATIQDGFNYQGDKQRAHWSTLTAEIPKAERTGRLDLRPESMATRVEHDTSGRVTGVVYVDGDGNEQRQRARAVCVACNAIETARLLLNSGSSLFPDGLANSSGQVGRNYMRHLTGSCSPRSTSRCGCTAVRRWPGSSATSRATTPSVASSAATTCSCSRSDRRFWRRSSARVRGGAISLRSWSSTTTWRACGWWARTSRRFTTGSR